MGETFRYRFVVIFLPLTNLVEVDTDLKLPIPPPPPPPPPKDEEEKEVKPPPPPMSPNELKPADMEHLEHRDRMKPAGVDVMRTTYLCQTLRSQE